MYVRLYFPSIAHYIYLISSFISIFLVGTRESTGGLDGVEGVDTGDLVTG